MPKDGRLHLLHGSCTLWLLPQHPLEDASWRGRAELCGHPIRSRLRSKVRFGNPLIDAVEAEYMYSFVLVVWEPVRASVPPTWHPLALERAAPDDPAELLRARRCALCGKWRVLPRHQQEPEEEFTCEALANARSASCAAPQRDCMARRGPGVRIRGCLRYACNECNATSRV